MVSNRWQRTQALISHIALALCVALPFFIFETTLTRWTQWSIIIFGYAIIIPLFRWLHQKYAVTFVRVFKRDYEVSARIVQRTLNAHNLPFTKRRMVNEQGDEQYVFQIRPGKMRLVVDEFMLNLMIDEHLSPQVATKLTLDRESAENADHMKQLRYILDEAFAF